MAENRDNKDGPEDTPLTSDSNDREDEAGADPDGNDTDSDSAKEGETTEAKVGIVINDTKKKRVKKLIKDVNDGILKIRAALLEIHETQGWLQLGCKTFEEMARKHFNKTRTHLYRMIEAAKVERNLRPDYDVSDIPYSVLRPLNLIESDREKQLEVWGAGPRGGHRGGRQGRHRVGKRSNQKEKGGPEGE